MRAHPESNTFLSQFFGQKVLPFHSFLFSLDAAPPTPLPRTVLWLGLSTWRRRAAPNRPIRPTAEFKAKSKKTGSKFFGRRQLTTVSENKRVPQLKGALAFCSKIQWGNFLMTIYLHRQLWRRSLYEFTLSGGMHMYIHVIHCGPNARETHTHGWKQQTINAF
jgi:hypothetical protein